MSLTFSVLGKPGNDNAVFIKIDTGQKIVRILLDTGANCLHQLNRNEIAQLDHVCFSHFHMDHICGFDTVFRLLYSKPEPVHFWGPKDTIKVVQSRAMGYTWNLVHGSQCQIYVHEIAQGKIRNVTLKLEEGFSVIHEDPSRDFIDNNIFLDENVEIKGTILDHKIDCMAYAISETPKFNFIQSEMEKLGLRPGVWCKELKTDKTGEIQINNQTYDLNDLKQKLLETTIGKKIGYITDAIYNEDAKAKLLPILKYADEVVMECAYLDEELSLATKHHHMTVTQVSSFARDAEIKHLNLFHISDRYVPEIRTQFLRNAREIFPNTDYPEHWGIKP
jgi:ribonuclease Z